jgi:hypothetical protein
MRLRVFCHCLDHVTDITVYDHVTDITVYDHVTDITVYDHVTDITVNDHVTEITVYASDSGLLFDVFSFVVSYNPLSMSRDSSYKSFICSSC